MHVYYIQRGQCVSGSALLKLLQLCCSSVAAPVFNVKSISFRFFFLTFLPKMSTSSMTPFRSTSRLRTSSALKQLRSLELLQQLMTRNGFFNNCSSNGNAFAVTTLTSALTGSSTTNNQQPLKLSRLGFVKSWRFLTYTLLPESPTLDTLCVAVALQLPMQSM